MVLQNCPLGQLGHHAVAHVEGAFRGEPEGVTDKTVWNPWKKQEDVIVRHASSK